MDISQDPLPAITISEAGTSCFSQKFRRNIVATMPGLKICCEPLPPKSNQPGLPRSLLYSGSRFQGQQKSKGNSYDVEVVLQVHDIYSGKLSRYERGFLCCLLYCNCLYHMVLIVCLFMIFLQKHVDEEKAFLCGYLKIIGLTEVSLCKYLMFGKVPLPHNTNFVTFEINSWIKLMNINPWSN